MTIHYYGEDLLDPQQFDLSQNLTYLWLHDCEILDKLSQFYCFSSGENESAWYNDDILFCHFCEYLFITMRNTF